MKDVIATEGITIELNWILVLRSDWLVLLATVSVINIDWLESMTKLDVIERTDEIGVACELETGRVGLNSCDTTLGDKVTEIGDTDTA